MFQYNQPIPPTTPPLSESIMGLLFLCSHPDKADLQTLRELYEIIDGHRWIVTNPWQFPEPHETRNYIDYLLAGNPPEARWNGRAIRTFTELFPHFTTHSKETV